LTDEEIIRRSQAAWNERGLDGFLEYLAPDVTWHAPDYLEGDEWNDRDSFEKAWRSDLINELWVFGSPSDARKQAGLES
jgi:ketosteroid isomerase-like protein